MPNDKMKFQTPNLTAEAKAKLAELFPGAVVEGKVNIDLLRAILGEDVFAEEAYEFTWVGKRAAIAEAGRPIRKTLRPCVEDSKDWDTTKNLYIEGDNLDVLKLLQESYLGKVKMIYIDPPYNTGHDFLYNDNFSQGKQEYDEEAGVYDEEGNRLFENTESNGRFHSDWCSMMYPRLVLARNLLKDDGVIFISIDDNEVHNLRKICDEVFGERNFVGEMIQLKGSTQNDSKKIQRNIEYILYYSKTNQDLLVTYKNYIEKKVYENQWYLGRDTGSSSGHDKLTDRIHLANQLYDGFEYFEDGNGNIVHAIAVADYDKNLIEDGAKEEEVYSNVEELINLGYVPIRPPKRKGNKLGRWTWGLDSFKKKWNNNEVFIKNNKNVIQKIFIENPEEIFEKNGDRFIKIGNGLPLKNILSDYPTSEGTKEMNYLFPENNKLFDNPKNIDMIKWFVQSSCRTEPNGDIILDFFSGSATTAHAVMQLNAEDGGNRKFIMVQLPEPTEPKSEAYKAGYHNICEIGKERIRRAGEKIKSEFFEKSKNSNTNEQRSFDDGSRDESLAGVDSVHGFNGLDIGFRVLKLADTNMNDVFYAPHEYTQDLLAGLEGNIKSDRTDMDLLFGCLLDWGLPLSMAHTHETIEDPSRAGSFTLHTYNNGDLMACFDENVPESVVREIANRKPLRAVFRDASFTSSPEKINVFEIFKLLAPNTTVRVI